MPEPDSIHAALYAKLAFLSAIEREEERQLKLAEHNIRCQRFLDDRIPAVEPDSRPVFWPPDSTLTAFQSAGLRRD